MTTGSNKRIKTVRNLLMVVVGTALLALGTGVFILPYNILSGGCAGIAVALMPLIHVSSETIVNALVLGMFFIGWIFLGTPFAAKTFVASLCYPLFLGIVLRVVPAVEVEPILASVYGGLLVGAGMGIVIRGGASTGGMDIPTLIIHKMTNIKVSKLVLAVDALTVFLGLVSFGMPEVLLGLISVYTTSLAVEKLMDFGAQLSKSVQIISPHYEEISSTIHKTLDRGTTLTEARGGFTQEKKMMLLVVVSDRQYQELLDIVNGIDPEAFVITTNASEVHGEGFSGLHQF